MDHKFSECTIGGQEFSFNLNLSKVRAIRKNFKLDLMSQFTDLPNEGDTTPDKLLIDEELVLDLAWFILEDNWKQVNPELSPRDDFEAQIQSLEELDSFREAFWESVVNFTPALKKDHMLTLWSSFKKEIKKLNLAEQISKSLSSDLLVEESTQETTLSEQS